MILLFIIQNANDLREVISTNDATIQGILIAVILALGTSTVYLYKQVQTLQSEYIEEMRKTQKLLLDANKSYNEFANVMRDFIQKLN